MDEEKEWEKRYNPNDFQKTIFSFTTQELRKLQPFESTIQMGQMAQVLLTNILRGECMKRVGAKNSSDSGLRYDLSTGQFIVYSPKVWCSACQIKKAEFSYENKPYCATCVEPIKAAMIQSAEKQPASKEKKTKKS